MARQELGAPGQDAHVDPCFLGRGVCYAAASDEQAEQSSGD
ncbi:MAG: hypothetical protein ACK4M2_06895 [Brevundimonas sp.]